MKQFQKIFVWLVMLPVLLMATVSLSAHDYLPGETQSQAIMLKGGQLYTVSDGLLEKSDIIFDNGRITAIGRNLTPPDGATVIDVTGKSVYPGLIAAQTSLGLVEIGAVRATRDGSEVGRINPNAQTRVAYNPDSELIPSVRSNGITSALVVPGGSLLRGQSSLMNLDGWTYESCTEKANVGLHLSWPATRINKAWWEERSAEEQKEAMVKNRRTLKQLFADARAYYTAKKGGQKPAPDSRWEAMIPLFDGRLPLYVHASDYRQIDQAVEFVREQKLKMILVGGTDAWMLTDLLIKNDIPVILGGVQSLPPRQDDAHDLIYQLPGRLEKAGVKFAISAGGASGNRNLPFQAAQGIPYGLSPEMALRSVTLTPAEIFGVAKDLGSLEVGKKATLIVSEGDLFEHLTSNVTLMYIEGRKVDLNNKHKELFEKYSRKK